MDWSARPVQAGRLATGRFELSAHLSRFYDGAALLDRGSPKVPTPMGESVEAPSPSTHTLPRRLRRVDEHLPSLTSTYLDWKFAAGFEDNR
jgi:hypothetical protein